MPAAHVNESLLVSLTCFLRVECLEPLPLDPSNHLKQMPLIPYSIITLNFISIRIDSTLRLSTYLITSLLMHLINNS